MTMFEYENKFRPHFDADVMQNIVIVRDENIAPLQSYARKKMFKEI